MSRVDELTWQVERLQAELRERDRAAAEAQVAASKAAEEAADKQASEARSKAESEQREKIRRGCWINHLLGKADPKQPIDFAAIDEAVAAVAPDKWPPGIEAKNLIGPIVRSDEQQQLTEATTLGSLLKGGAKQ